MTSNSSQAAQFRGQGYKRVVITGVGLVTPAGRTLDSYWKTITSGESVLRPISRVDISELNFTLGGEVPNEDFDPSEQPSEFEKLDRGLLLCRVASRRALLDARLELSALRDKEMGILLGSGFGPAESLEEGYLGFARGGSRAISPRTVTSSMFNTLSAHVGIEFGLTGPQMTVASACASSNMAISRAFDLIRSGKQNIMLTGGVETPFSAAFLASWSAMRVCSKATDKNLGCLPFDQRRCGLILAEGSAMFVLEELESALERKAPLYAEVLGYGENNDATHITQPSSQSQAKAIRQALSDAGVAAEDVDYVNAHGTGTLLNDICETEALKASFGGHTQKLAISSTKSVLGHALGASGALELPAILGAFAHQVFPPTANLCEHDPKCDLDYVPGRARPGKLEIAISNSFAFGGSNSVLVLGKPR